MVWCVWTAVLAAMPYGVYSFGPLIPGQVSIAAFGLAVMLFVVIALLASCLGQGWQGIVARARVIVVRVGWVATAGLAAAEVYALVRGNAGLDTIEQIAFNDVMSLVEFVCVIAAVSCWALSSVGPGFMRESPSRARLIGLFVVGGVWPTACVLVAAAPGFDSAFTACALCAVVFALALLGARRWQVRGRSAWDVSALLAGHMAFLAFRSFVGEYRSDLLGAGLPNTAFYGFFLVLVTVLALVLLVRVRGAGEPREGEAGLLVYKEPAEGERDIPGDSAERRMEQHLAKAAKIPLTEREAAVLARTAMGATVVSIATELGLAQATVATYRHRGYEKLGVGGARELREYVATLDMSEEPSVTKETKPSSCESGAAQKRGSFVPKAIACALIVLVLLLDTVNNVQIGEHWYHRGTFYLTWAVSCVLAVVSFARMLSFHQTTESPRGGQGPLELAATTVLSLVVVCLISAGSFCGWRGMWLYKIWGPSLLLVASLVVGRASLPREGYASFWRTMLSGFDILFSSPLLPLLASAGIAVTYYWELYFVGFVTDWIYVLFPALISLGVVIFVYQTRIAAVPVSEPTEKERDRALHYFKGRGIDGLRAEVVIDVACGYSVPEVCRRRHTTPATVRSYRQRTYDDCKVHCIDDLRKLLVEEVGFTSLERLHPQK